MTTTGAPMTTTTETTPVVDRLFTLITHLAKHNQSDLAEHMASIQPTYNGGLNVQFNTNQRTELLALAATLTDPQVVTYGYPVDKYHPTGWFELTITGTVAGLPLRAWVAIDGAVGDTAQSVAAAALTALADDVSREG